jgi:preprotein translocase SecE subunit
MAVGLYKPGQGYWTRVLTATAIGILTLAAAAWAFKQMTVVADKLPRNVWVMGVQNATGNTPAPGTQLTLSAAPASGSGEGEAIGTATLKSWEAASQQLSVDSFVAAKDGLDPSLARIIKGGEFSATIPAKSVSGLPSVAPELLSGAAAGLIILIGFVIAYYFCATKPGSVEFLISTDMEMKKVNWSTRKDIISSTWVVIFAALLLALSLFIVDMGFQQFFKAIGVLAG